MYESFFGLRERPFDLTPDPRFLVLTEAHAEVLSTLQYAIASRKGVTLLIGEAGLGKTTLLRAALDKQPDKVHFIYLQNPVLSRDEFVELLARRFGLSHAARSSKTALLFELEELLQQSRARGETTLLVIDEGQSLPAELLEEIRLLANIETTQLIREMMNEVIEAANRQGISTPIDAAAFINRMIDVTSSMGAYRPSMMIDRQQGSPLELDAIYRIPLERAAGAGVPMTRVGMLHALLEVTESQSFNEP